MKKIAFCIDKYFLKNKIFDLNDEQINRDNYIYVYYLLKETLKKYGYDLSTYDINNIEESNIIIYNDMPKNIYKNNDKKKYLFLFESKVIMPQNWDFKLHKYFDKIFTWDDTIIDNKKYFKINYSYLLPTNININLNNKINLCTLIAGNKMVKHPLQLYSKRLEIIKWFEKNHSNEFDFYGVGWDNYRLANKYFNFIFKKIKLNKIFKPRYKNYKGKVKSKIDILQKYKFCICYENAKDIKGYITEKIFDCFFAGCIPIYLGSDNICEHIPQGCFIDMNKFQSYEKLYNFMIDMKDEEYLNYLNNIKKFLTSKKSYNFSADKFVKTIIKHIINDDNE